MKLYFVQIRWNNEVSPLLITFNKEKAEKEKLQVDLNYQENARIEGETAWIDELEVDPETDIFYDYDWFNKSND